MEEIPLELLWVKSKEHLDFTFKMIGLAGLTGRYFANKDA